MNGVYKYNECGLDNVLLHNITFLKDDNGDSVIEIKNIVGLHRAIAEGIISKPAVITGAELRFLRTEMCLRQSELADKLSNNHQTIGRWERGENPIDKTSDTLLRIIVKEELSIKSDEKVDDYAKYSKNEEKKDISIDASNPKKYKVMKEVA